MIKQTPPTARLREGFGNQYVGRKGLVLGFINQGLFGNPGHHGAQLGADFFNRMRVIQATGRLEAGLVDLVFQHPVTGEFARLNVMQNALHFRLGFVGDDARAGDIFAIFRRVGDLVVHVGDAAFIDQINDQLHFVQAFEIGHFRCIPGFD